MTNVLRCILQECGVFTWRVSDCEELVGVTHMRWWGCKTGEWSGI